MNCLILNRESFELPADGWYQLAPLGEFPHAGAGVVQVVDAAACEAMANAFRAEAAKPNFAGLLIDFDHFSLDGKQKSEAAGWIMALEYRGQTADNRLQTADLGSGGKTADGRPQTEDLGNGEKTEDCRPQTVDLGSGGKTADGRPQTADSYNADELTTKNSGNTKTDSGLWGKIRWSDTGEACVRGGRYRFLSPVWARADCEDLGNGRLRPVRLMNAAVTNDPNIKGMVPLSNRGMGETEDCRPQTTDRETEDLGSGREVSLAEAQRRGGGEIANAGGGVAKRFMWVLGDGDRNCPSCAGLAGQVHAMADWKAAGLRPGSGNLFCQGHCKCRLVESDEPEGGSLAVVAVRAEVENRRPQTTDCRPQTLTTQKVNRQGAKNAKGDLVDFCSVGRGWTRGLPVRAANREMEGVMADEVKVVTEGESVEELANALRHEQEKNAVLMDQVVALEDDLVNRQMGEFEAVISEATREFWRGQLLANRVQAEAALKELAGLAAARDAGQGRDEGGNLKPEGERRRPLHNRATVRPVMPEAAGGGEARAGAVADSQAVRIRNRAHELKKAEGIPFPMAFRRAEAEILGVGETADRRL